jgi:RimJ/RimL family protein N-acetyltransferase
MSPQSTLQLKTERLLLRATRPEDADCAFEILSNWHVSRMLRLVSYPIDAKANSNWFANHSAEWLAGTAYRFSIVLDSRMVGVIDIDSVDGHSAVLGYWLDESCWGKGFAKEAAIAIVSFAFRDLGLELLCAGHAADNLASGKVLTSLGFVHVDDVIVPSLSRRAQIGHRRYQLKRTDTNFSPNLSHVQTANN